ncbi:MAG TPA: DUF485 domain-containing protein [Streptosporangiaceae bacterium]|nr:DUF485 domain-containing protein [Streptosporangiaceae bacterium]
MPVTEPRSESGYEIVQASREFQNLRRRFRRFAVPAMVFFLTWYFLYVISAAFAPGFMRIKVAGEINIGLCFGLLQFVSTFAITMLYGRWARRNIDPVSDRLRQRVARGRRT